MRALYTHSSCTSCSPACRQRPNSASTHFSAEGAVHHYINGLDEPSIGRTAVAGYRLDFRSSLVPRTCFLARHPQTCARNIGGYSVCDITHTDTCMAAALAPRLTHLDVDAAPNPPANATTPITMRAMIPPPRPPPAATRRMDSTALASVNWRHRC